jgi:hypothetical protein
MSVVSNASPTNLDDEWENSDIGTTADHRRATPEEEKQIDDAIGMTKLDFKLPKDLIQFYKDRAKVLEVNWVYLIRNTLLKYKEAVEK